MSNSNTSSGGTSILTILLVVFIVLKLCKVITWSWWLVLIPLWIELFLIGIVVLALVFTGSQGVSKKKRSDKIKW
jgi:uncharacterized protein (DUF983 family)